MHDSRSSHVDICWRGDMATVAVHGEIDFLTASVLSARLDELIDVARPRRLVLDLADVAFLDCAGARVIAGARAALPECCQVVICSLRPSPRRILEITGLWHGCLVDGAARTGA